MTVALMIFTWMQPLGGEVMRFTDLEACERARPIYEEMGREHGHVKKSFRCISGLAYR